MPEGLKSGRIGTATGKATARRSAQERGDWPMEHSQWARSTYCPPEDISIPKIREIFHAGYGPLRISRNGIHVRIMAEDADRLLRSFFLAQPALLEKAVYGTRPHRNRGGAVIRAATVMERFRNHRPPWWFSRVGLNKSWAVLLNT